MACETLGIVGESGTGKTTSFRNLDHTTTFIISVTGKPLSFRGWKSKYKNLESTKDENGVVQYTGNYYVCNNYEKISKILNVISLKMPHIKTIILDDLQYVLAFEFVERATEGGYTKFSEYAQHLLKILRMNNSLRDDLILIFTMHSENVGDVLDPKIRIKTLGKLLTEKVTLEGLFTYLFFTKVEHDEATKKTEYKFITNNDGVCTAKTPLGLFEELYIDNDLSLILPEIEKYNNEC